MQTSLALAAEMPQFRNRFTNDTARSELMRLVRHDVPRHIGAYFQRQVECAVPGSMRTSELIGSGDTIPDLVLPHHDTKIEVKSGGTADPMRFRLKQLEDYRQHEEEEGIRTLYWFLWYKSRGPSGERLAAESRRQGGLAGMQRFLAEAAVRAVVLDSSVVLAVSRCLQSGVARLPGRENAEGVSKMLVTFADSAFNGYHHLLSDLGLERKGWRRLLGEMPVGAEGELFLQRARRIPAAAILCSPHAERLVRDGGPLSLVFPETQLPKTRYRCRTPRGVLAENTPF